MTAIAGRVLDKSCMACSELAASTALNSSPPKVISRTFRIVTLSSIARTVVLT
jgi:hypothetical protein